MTESNLESLRADVAFLGADAIDVHGNVYSQPPDNTPMLLRMAASAERVYIAADHSKLGKTALRRFGRLAQWDGLVTDDGADKEFLDALEQAGARVIVGTCRIENWDSPLQSDPRKAARPMEHFTLSPLDYIAFAAFFVGLSAVGYWAGRKEHIRGGGVLSGRQEAAVVRDRRLVHRLEHQHRALHRHDRRRVRLRHLRRDVGVDERRRRSRC